MRMLLIALLSFTVFTALPQPARNDVVIDEIMADPSPPAGLPEVEYIELKNVSQKPVNLNGWKINDAAITANIIIQPDSFLTICANSAVAALAVFGATAGVGSFPALDNDGKVIALRSKDGRLIHAVEYHKSWYGNPVKSAGGWSLEMIDTRNPCTAGVNWTSSTAAKGGTPGRKNAVDAVNKDTDPPALMKAFAPDSVSIMLVFNEPLDSMPAAAATGYIVSDGIGVSGAAVMAPLFNKVLLRLNQSLLRNKVYAVTAQLATDCSGNKTGARNSAKTGWASPAASGDAVINEILFNPKPDGTDYVEIYNSSNRIIDLKDLYIANRNTAGIAGSLRQLAQESTLLLPMAYMVITENAHTVQEQYLAKDPDAFTEISPMPSYPDDKGTVLLFNAQGVIIDELRYEEKWHFALLANTEGITLERISELKPAQDQHNWHSASSTSGYGTPGYKNSQSAASGAEAGVINVSPKVFSPDNDGYDDVTTITYRFPAPGYVCNITIFNADGKPVRYVARSALCGLNGYFRWDGLDEKGNRLTAGVYVLLAEAFNLQSNTRQYKQAVIIAQKLQ